ncbi:MAG TPA: MMPL family transporter, partial [Geminicoccaceae bacterium]
SLTGPAALDLEELQSVRAGATLAAVLTTLAVSLLLVWGLGSVRLIAATLFTLAIGLILTAAFAALAIGRLNLISVTFAVLFVGLGVDFGIHLVLRFREALAAGMERRDGLAEAVPAVAGALSLSALCAALGFLAFVPTDYQGLAELGVISAAGMALALVTSLTLLPALLSLFGPAHASAVPAAPHKIAITHRPRLVLPISLLLAVGSIFALPMVGFDFNPLNLQDPESESVVTFERLAEDPRTSPYNIDVVAPDLEAAKGLADRLRALPAVGEVVSIESFVPDDQATKLEVLESLAFFLGPVLEPADAGELDPAGRRAAFERLRATLETYFEGGVERSEAPGAAALATALARFAAAGLDEARLDALDQALTGALPTLLDQLRSTIDAGRVTFADLPEELVDRWVSDGGGVRLLVRPAERVVGNDELRAFAEAVLAVEPAATGTPVVVREAGQVVIGAFRTASWIALGAISLVLIVVLRRLPDVLLVLIPLLLAVLFTAATAVLLGVQLNFANVIVLPLLLGLGVSGAIHVVLRARQSGSSENLERTSTPRAVLFSALTTIASFGSLAVSDHRGLASMGLLLTIAILWSLVCTLVVLPNLLALRRPRGGPS